ncbi:hypothetical protein NDU88_005990 [Pleurodeles waltl]|uniref:Basic proline-rich protein-like n=1 Tax=Pleurodeles waltl TaxID=8319 RepID=A0AAV7MZK8_PLEWA|nr:hypothetical protein NDU88_005990 [Pleurodeles waltl]
MVPTRGAPISSTSQAPSQYCLSSVMWHECPPGSRDNKPVVFSKQALFPRVVYLSRQGLDQIQLVRSVLWASVFHRWARSNSPLRSRAGRPIYHPVCTLPIPPRAVVHLPQGGEMGLARFSLHVEASALPQRPTLSSPTEAFGLPAERALPPGRAATSVRLHLHESLFKPPKCSRWGPSAAPWAPNSRSGLSLGPAVGAPRGVAAPLLTKVPLFLGRLSHAPGFTSRGPATPPVRQPGSAPLPGSRPRSVPPAAPLQASRARGSTPASPAGPDTPEALWEREPLLTTASHLHDPAKCRRAPRAVRARPPATPWSTPKDVRGCLRVLKRRLAAPHWGLYIPLHGPVYWLTGGVDSGRILLGPDRAASELCVRHVERERKPLQEVNPHLVAGGESRVALNQPIFTAPSGGILKNTILPRLGAAMCSSGTSVRRFHALGARAPGL